MKKFWIIALILLISSAIQAQHRVRRSELPKVPVTIVIKTENGTSIATQARVFYQKKFVELLRQKERVNYILAKGPEDAQIIAELTMTDIAQSFSSTGGYTETSFEAARTNPGKNTTSAVNVPLKTSSAGSANFIAVLTVKGEFPFKKVRPLEINRMSSYASNLGGDQFIMGAITELVKDVKRYHDTLNQSGVNK